MLSKKEIVQFMGKKEQRGNNTEQSILQIAKGKSYFSLEKKQEKKVIDEL